MTDSSKNSAPYYIVALAENNDENSLIKNSALLDSNKSFKQQLRRNVDYGIVCPLAWETMKSSYDVEIPVGDVYNLHVEFSVHRKSTRSGCPESHGICHPGNKEIPNEFHKEIPNEFHEESNSDRHFENQTDCRECRSSLNACEIHNKKGYLNKSALNGSENSNNHFIVNCLNEPDKNGITGVNSSNNMDSYFGTNDTSIKDIKVYAIESLYDTILTLFSNKNLPLAVFNRYFQVLWKGQEIDPMVNFSYFQEVKDIYLVVERRNTAGKNEERDLTKTPNSTEKYNEANHRESNLQEYRRNIEIRNNENLSDFNFKNDTEDEYNTNESSYSVGNSFFKFYNNSSFISQTPCHGIPNLGNTCFINAAVQCLLNCDALRMHFLSGYSKTSHANITNSFCKLVYSIANNLDIKESIYGFKNRLSEAFEMYKGNEEHDSFELVNNVLDTINEEFIKSQASDANNNSSDGSVSIAKHLFYGKTAMKMTCCNCLFSKIKIEDFLSLSLPVTNENIKRCREIYILANREEIEYWKISVPVSWTIGEIKGYIYGSGEDRNTRFDFIAVEYNGNNIVGICDESEKISKFNMKNRICLLEYTRQDDAVNKSINSDREADVRSFDSTDEKNVCNSTPHNHKTETTDGSGENIAGNIKKNSVRYVVCRIYITRFMFYHKKISFDVILAADKCDSAFSILNQLYSKTRRFVEYSQREFIDNAKVICSGQDPVLKMRLFSVYINGQYFKSMFLENIQPYIGNVEYIKKYNDSNNGKYISRAISNIVNTSKDNNLESCIKLFTMEDFVNFFCTCCGKEASYILKIDINTLPRILILQLKRFTYSGAERKIDKLIDFPLELTIEERALSIQHSNSFDKTVQNNHYTHEQSRKSVKYRLIATDNHLEVGLGYGHYISYINKENKWYCCNDAVVTKCDGPDKKSAYVLFYEKI
ncbi:hypothetical protein ENBRE01_0866 [Enteropsectra breve]|nr:hypothetical protein ENBRE01_0866 [Enteropsectra breve]